MPGFKSDAQRQKLLELVKAGKLSQTVFDKMEADSSKNLPERTTPQMARVPRPPKIPRVPVI